MDPEGQGDSRKLARTWVQKDKVICATEPGKDKGIHYYDYDYRYHYYAYAYRYHSCDYASRYQYYDYDYRYHYSYYGHPT